MRWVRSGDFLPDGRQDAEPAATMGAGQNVGAAKTRFMSFDPV
jgi:hypothetical protein